MNLRKTLQKLSPEGMLFSGLILLGLVLRLRQYLIGRSLWLDEAMLALNIIQRSYAGLFQQLDNNQGGPVAFLLAEKGMIALLGIHDATLRLIPFLAGCASLVFFALVVRQALRRIGALIALALFSIGAPLVYYTSEVKQYSSDVLMALLLFWLAGEMILRSEQAGFRAGRNNLLLAVTGALSLWFSHPALFVLAGIGATLLLRDVLQKDIPRLRQIALVIAIWVLSFTLLYFVSLRGLASDQFLHDYWAASFVPLPPWTSLDWYPTTLVGIIENPGGMGSLWILPALLMPVGLIALLRGNWQFGSIFGLTLVATLAASEMQIYPFSGRMILFAAPIFLLLVGAGVDAIAGWLRGPLRLPWGLQAPWLGGAAALVMAGFLLAQPVVTAAGNFVQPNYGEHIRPSMAFLQANRRPGDKIYVYYWALPAFQYYAPFYGISGSDFVAGQNHQDDPQGLFDEIYALRSKNVRLWIIFSHVYERGNYNEMDALLTKLDQVGHRRREFIEAGTSVYLYLYDLSPH